MSTRTSEGITEEAIQEYADVLSRDGVVVIKGYLDPEHCDALKQELEEVIESGRLRESDGQMNYHELASQNEPVINRREGADSGMLDIFNMHLAVPELSRIKNDPAILEIVNRAGALTHSADNLNIYHNRSVTHTRGYHADTYEEKFKAFVYLTDVPTDAYGPFSYIKASHQPSPIKRRLQVLVNRLRGARRTDALFYSRSREIRCTAPRGTLIIGNQTGLHRGHPQEAGKERMLLSTSYHPVSTSS